MIRESKGVKVMGSLRLGLMRSISTQAETVFIVEDNLLQEPRKLLVQRPYLQLGLVEVSQRLASVGY